MSETSEAPLSDPKHWIELREIVKDKNEEITQLKAAIEVKDRALKFYGNPFNWATHKDSQGNDYCPVMTVGNLKAEEALLPTVGSEILDELNRYKDFAKVCYEWFRLNGFQVSAIYDHKVWKEIDKVLGR